ncbi:YhdP family protein [Shewanella sp. GXUN23E]|uniref:YhdP family protein n=1 Tax=Shewanella sp. GXUN23E TaxID=3422498 RepID=UPI003D7CF61A
MSQSSAFARFSRLCGQLLAVALILFALTVSLIRGLLPQLDNVRQDLVQMLEADYGIRVEVGQLEAQWQAFGPALTVRDLVLPVQDKLPLTLDVEQVQVKLDFWESLVTLSPQIEDVLFDGVRVQLDLERLKQLSAAQQGSANLDWLYRLLLEQLQQFSISRLSLELRSPTEDLSPIFLQDLHWLNTNGRHQGQGALYLDKDASDKERLTLMFDLKGDGNRPDSIRGQAYLAAQALDLGEWASRRPNPYDPKASLPLEGVVNLQAWLELGQRRITSGIVAFAPSYLEWQLNQQKQQFSIQGGELSWVPSEQGWQIFSKDLQLETNGQAWPDPQLSLIRQGDALSLHTAPLLAQRLLPLLPLIPGISLDELHQYQQMAPHGEIGPLSLYWPLAQSPRVQLALEQLQWSATESVPGLSGLTATLGWQDGKLYFALPAQPLTVDFNGGFSQPLTFDLQPLKGQFDSASQTLLLPNLVLDNADLHLVANTRLELADQPLLALAADVNIKNAAHADRYYPIDAMGQDLVDYLSEALIKGESKDAKVVWNGELSRFPYDDHSGVFQAGFHLNKAEFEFQPDWPAVTELDLYALFENARMDIWVQNGKLLNVSAKGAHVFIPDMGEHTELGVKADLRTAARHGVAVINASPLKDTVGSTLDVVQLAGDIGVKLDLTIPFYDGASEQILGSVQLKDNPLYVSSPGIALTNVSGEVAFHNDRVTAQGLQAKLYRQPLQLSFTSESRGKDYALDLDLSGYWRLNKLPEELDNPLSDYYHGRADWAGKLTMIFDDGGYRLQARVGSNLTGVTLDLPAPFNKAADTKLPLNIELVGDNRETNLGIRIGKKAEFWGGFNSKSGSGLAHYDLLLGRLFQPGDALSKQQGHIQLALAQADMDEWMPIIEGFLPAADTVINLEGEDIAATPRGDGAAPTQHSADTSSSLFPPLQSIAGDIGELQLLGQTLTHLKLLAAPTDNAWRIQGESPQFAGHVDFYPDWSTQGIKLVASRLYLSSQTGQQQQTDGETLGGTHLPPLAADVDDFRFDDKPLGHLVLQGTPAPEGYEIQTLSLSSPAATLNGKGKWLHGDGRNLTDISLTLKADNFDALTERLGIDPGVKESSLMLTANLNWQGAPYDFTVASLNGDVRFDLGKGHMSQISDKGARIFSLFSMDSLLRKLSLDFSDVFGKGLYFNSFGGTLQIDNGVVKTTDTEMDAVAGNMKVRGYTDLRTESLNYDISFVPQLASSVPTVVLLSTSAWTLGVGAFALTKVLEPVIEVISEIRFRLTGTMSDPKLEELERKSKEIEIPESVLPRRQATEPAGTESSVSPQSSSGQSSTQSITGQPAGTDDVKPVGRRENNGGNAQARVIPIHRGVAAQGVQDAGQFAAVSKQSGRQRQSSAARIAA